MCKVFGSPSSYAIHGRIELRPSISIGGNRYFKDVKVKVLSSTTALVDARDYDSLRDVFNIVCTSLGLNTPLATPPAMESTIKNRHSGQDLTSI